VLHCPVATAQDRLGRWANLQELPGERCLLSMSTEFLQWAAMALGSAGAEVTDGHPPQPRRGTARLVRPIRPCRRPRHGPSLTAATPPQVLLHLTRRPVRIVIRQALGGAHCGRLTLIEPLGHAAVGCSSTGPAAGTAAAAEPIGAAPPPKPTRRGWREGDGNDGSTRRWRASEPAVRWLCRAGPGRRGADAPVHAVLPRLLAALRGALTARVYTGHARLPCTGTRWTATPCSTREVPTMIGGSASQLPFTSSPCASFWSSLNPLSRREDAAAGSAGPCSLAWACRTGPTCRHRPSSGL